MRSMLVWLGIPATLLTSALGAQDTSPHQVRFVTVEEGVQLEVLNWGGSGRPVVLLAGLEATAHDLDLFARKLAAQYHVYAVTRRGFGRSSTPRFGYDADRLGDDVLAVLDSLGLHRPILVGHSIAGQELNSIGSRHPDRVSGLFYLDAGYEYAFYDESQRSFTIEVNEVIRQLGKLRFGSGAGPHERQQTMRALADTSLPALLQGLRWHLEQPASPPSPIRQPIVDPVIAAVFAGQRKYRSIDGPVLAIFASPPEAPPGAESDPEMRGIVAEVDSVNDMRVSAFARGVPQARVVRIPRASHFVFRTHEARVLSEIRSFIDSLPKHRD